jgi:hypothetical protein
MLATTLLLLVVKGVVRILSRMMMMHGLGLFGVGFPFLLHSEMDGSRGLGLQLFFGVG